MASLHRVSVAYGGGFSCSEGQCCWSFTRDHCCRCGFTSPARCCWGDFTSQGLLLRWIHWGSLPLWWFQHTGSVLKRWLHNTEAHRGSFNTQAQCCWCGFTTKVVLFTGPMLLRWLHHTQGQCCWGDFSPEGSVLLMWLYCTEVQCYWGDFITEIRCCCDGFTTQRISAAEVASLKRISASGWLHHRRANAALWLHYTWSMLMGGFITQSVLLRWLHYTEGQCCCGNIITQGQCWGGDFTTHRQCWGDFTTQGQCRWAGLAVSDKGWCLHCTKVQCCLICCTTKRVTGHCCWGTQYCWGGFTTQRVSTAEEDTLHGHLARYIKLRVVHAPGLPGRFSPPLRVSDPDMRYGMNVPGLLTSSFLWSRWWGKRSWHFWCMHSPQFYIYSEAHWVSTADVASLQCTCRVSTDMVDTLCIHRASAIEVAVLLRWLHYTGLLLRWFTTHTESVLLRKFHHTERWCCWVGFAAHKISAVEEASLHMLSVAVVASLHKVSMLLMCLHCIGSVRQKWLHRTVSADEGASLHSI